MSDTATDIPYLVLARKYRPACFDDLRGQSALVRTLTNAIQMNRIAHAFLLTGIRGIGKTTTARIIARALNCVGADGKGSPTISPCGECHHCVSISEDRHPDVLEMDAASRTGVNDIRELIENAHYLPSSARYKIYIIDEVHMLSNSAFNALLKTLEEPPAHVKFIFATTELRKIPITIISRCQRFDLRRLSTEEMSEHLRDIAEKEGFTLENEALTLISHAAEGSVRDGLSLLDQAIAQSVDGNTAKITASTIQTMLGTADKTAIYTLFEQLSSGEIQSALQKFEGLYAAGADPALILTDLLDVCHTITQLKVTPQLADDVNTPELQRTKGKTLAEMLPMSFLTRSWQMLLKGLQEVQSAPNSKMAGEMILVRMAYSASLPSPAKVIKDIQEGRIPQTQTLPTPPIAPSVSEAPKKKHLITPDKPPTEQKPSTEPIDIPENFTEWVELFKTHNEPLLYHMLQSDVNLISYEKGNIALRHSKAVTPDFLKKLREYIPLWTGMAWKITISKEKGQTSLKKIAEQAIADEKDAMAKHPKVKAVLETFPGAYIKHIREVEPV